MQSKPLPHRFVSAESDPESADDDPSLPGGLPESAVTDSDEPNARGTEISDSRVTGQDEDEEEQEEQDEDENKEGCKS